MKYHYKTQGTCSTAIDFDIENDVLKEVRYTGGCNGNLQGIAALVKGMRVDDVIARLDGIRCGSKATSCPDQLSKALRVLQAAQSEE
ncbi:MAG TPA: TIGR03905 family TSCPD domain-containing protein [Candidatus Phocaeicola gallistercoris]|nr:TIGR03905 family TSCPD domain-containing protein [Candidatus Phocaeicola gallistercoris]